MNHRNKLVKMADTSPGGWDTVEQYEQQKVGDDSGDEKKIAAAERKALAAKKLKTNYRLPLQQQAGNYGQRQLAYRYAPPTSNRFRYHSAFTRPYTTYRNGAKPTDTCLGCGAKGHWQRDCTASASTLGKNKLRYDLYYYAHSSLNPNTSVKGRLKNHIKFWEDTIGANSEVLSIIRDGLKINFSDTPKTTELKNNKSALKHPEFVKTEILKLLKDGCIVEKNGPSYVVNPLTVADNNEKLRLILDLRYINQYIPQEYVRYDDWKVFDHYLN